MFIALPVLLVMEIIVSGTGPPDVKNFTPVLSKELEFRITDYKKAFVGRVVDYQNPDDPNEFVRVYYRQVAIVSERAQEKSVTQAGGRDGDSSNLNYHQKEETEALDRVQQATDAFAYVQWRTERDPRTGHDIKTDFFRAWLLEQHGNWTQTYGYDLFTTPFSEPSMANFKKRINVGIQFTLGGVVHIVRIDQDEILAPVKEVTDDKK